MAGACATVEAPPADLSEPGWTTWRGQALWHPSADRGTLAGELIAARHRDGGVLVNFSKPPLPVFTARSTPQRWWLDFVERGRSYAGRGEPPDRFVWFRLPAIIEGEAAPRGWEVTRDAEDELTLRRSADEWIRLVLDP